MKYVRVEAIFEDGWPRGFMLDPERYLNALPEIASDLPEGAREFATDPMHSDFFGNRCVKDLHVASVSLSEGVDSPATLQIVLKANPWKHEEDLYINYRGPICLNVSVASTSGDFDVAGSYLGDVQLDEIMPAEGGCTQEIKTVNGSIFVLCRDLVAEWKPPLDSRSNASRV
jgi:hypothetical protein